MYQQNEKEKLEEIKIGNKIIGEGKTNLYYCRSRVNHNGRLDLALQLVDVAADAGADAIKFQTFKAEQVVTRSVEMAEYQKKEHGQN